VPAPGGAVLAVRATGICRSDWHGWMGHDPDIRLPHVPGHEIAGTVEAVGAGVERWCVGQRVTVPFVCGRCEQCRSGNQQVCDRQFQPGFTHWGSYAEYVAIEYADVNLVELPESLDFVTAASLGCRFATAFRAVVDQGSVRAGTWVAVHGCGGVGLSAVMIATALGAHAIAIDIDRSRLERARSIGAVAAIDANDAVSVVDTIRRESQGGAQVSIDALGSVDTAANSIRCLRKRGRHVQVGLLAGRDRHPPLPMELVIASELQIVGSHGLQAHAYPRMLGMIADGRLDPAGLLSGTTTLSRAAERLHDAGGFGGAGVTVIDRF
jgi:alcohol dehydrogenase